MASNKRELIVKVLSEHHMTTSNRYVGEIRQNDRHCASCGVALPWRDWESALVEHQADVLEARLWL